MLELEAFCALIDQQPPDFYQAVKARKLVRADFPPLDQLNQKQREIYASQEEKVKYVYYRENFKAVLSRNCKYRKPLLINTQHLQEALLKQERIYVSVFFATAGRHTYIVNDLENG